MSVDHEKHRSRLKEYSKKSGHAVEYNDGGASQMTLQEKDRENRTKELWKMGAYDEKGMYVGVGKGVKHK